MFSWDIVREHQRGMSLCNTFFILCACFNIITQVLGIEPSIKQYQSHSQLGFSFKNWTLRFLLSALWASNFIKKETLAQVFSCEFCEISKYTFSYMTHPVAASSSQIRAFLICFMSPRIFTGPNGIQRRDICGNVFNLTGNFQ